MTERKTEARLREDDARRFPGMETIESGIMEKVLQRTEEHSRRKYRASDVKAALAKDVLTLRDYGALLSHAAENLLEEIARRAKAETAKHFGNSVSLFTPLYISNFCDNHCTYCGFNSENQIARGKLSLEEIDRELRAISETGLCEILLLTGESCEVSDVAYIGEAVRLSKKYFSTIGIEIYPLNTDEYAHLHQCGVDFVNVYQETYDLALYEKCHVNGPKRVFSYRFDAPERALCAGMRGVSFGALLGLGDFRADAFAAGAHAHYLQQKYPHAEIAFSVPRIRAFPNSAEVNARGVGERQLLQTMLAYRIFMPFASVTISTRERAGFRDNVVGLVANKISAGVKVSVGGHGAEKKGDEQFDVCDPRSVSEIHAMILGKGLQPVYTDYIRLMEGGAQT